MIIWADVRPQAAQPHIHPTLSRTPAFPSTAGRVINLLSSADPDISKLVALIQKDPTFGAELLRLANSAAFSTHREVSSLTQAIALAGFDRLRSLTLAIALRSVLRNSLHEPGARRCWTHSLAAAKIAETIAGLFGVNAADAYTFGLLHDIGRIGLMAADTASYRGLLDRKYPDCVAVAKAERKLLGLDHSEAGEVLARYWGLPEIIAETAGSHHQPFKAMAGDEVKVTHLACRLADVLGFHSAQTEVPPPEEIVAPCDAPVGAAILGTLENLKAVLGGQVTDLGLG